MQAGHVFDSDNENSDIDLGPEAPRILEPIEEAPANSNINWPIYGEGPGAVADSVVKA